MMTITTDRINISEGKTSLLEDRFILTQLQGSTLVFPAIWVTEILHVNRSQILDLPFYDPLLIGIIDRDGQITPLISATGLFGLPQHILPERLLVVRLMSITTDEENQHSRQLGNVGLIVDRLIGTTTREELPLDIFTTDRPGEMIMMRSSSVPATIWQPQ